MKSSKEHLIASLIVVMSFIVIGISGSYAFYENAINTSGETGLNVNSGSNNLTIDFATENGQIINSSLAGLINDAEVTSKADYTEFSVSLPNNSKVETSIYNLYLTEIRMTDNFKSEYLKWALYDSSNNPIKDTDGNAVVGNFSGVTLSPEADSNGIYDASDIVILSNKEVNKGATHTYRLYVWLSNDPDKLQNELLEGSLSMKVGFKAVVK
ncbi:MAG: hypothetical protein E7163_01890 [Firmicutes bacterium]|nr:hypothetical protein [Bacillota bacterium]